MVFEGWDAAEGLFRLDQVQTGTVTSTVLFENDL